MTTRKIISLPAKENSRAEPVADPEEKAKIIYFGKRKPFVPKKFQLAMQLIPPADRHKKCPYCAEIAIFTFSWFCNGVKVRQQQHIATSCHKYWCKALARSKARRKLLLTNKLFLHLL